MESNIEEYSQHYRYVEIDIYHTFKIYMYIHKYFICMCKQRFRKYVIIFSTVRVQEIFLVEIFLIL